MKRITRKRLVNRVAIISRLQHRPEDPLWRKIDGVNVATVGMLRLDYNSVYGGYHLEEVCSEGGGVRVLNGPRMTTREFDSFLSGMIVALEHEAPRPCPSSANAV